jgi:hypothetical protein
MNLSNKTGQDRKIHSYPGLCQQSGAIHYGTGSPMIHRMLLPDFRESCPMPAEATFE